jgi:hypothetical protein
MQTVLGFRQRRSVGSVIQDRDLAIYQHAKPETVMPDVIDFEEAMKRTEDEDRALLIGNGFSAQYFSYKNLLDKSGLATGIPVRDLFDTLGTVDFETVVRAL